MVVVAVVAVVIDFNFWSIPFDHEIKILILTIKTTTRNATIPGWIYKGTTSSDEITGVVIAVVVVVVVVLLLLFSFQINIGFNTKQILLFVVVAVLVGF